jgi:hypothetical protein
VAERLAETEPKTALGLEKKEERQSSINDGRLTVPCVEVTYPTVLTLNASRRVLRVKEALECTVYCTKTYMNELW